MADNIAITAGAGTSVATDDDGTAHHQYVKLEFGADNTQTKVSTSNPLPVTAVGASSSMGIYFDRGNPTVTPAVAFNSGVVGATTQRVVHATDVAGSMNIIAQGLAFLNVGHTASIFSVSGSSAAAQTAGITLISPSSGYNFKIFAYSIQTTGVLASALTFANGNSASQTEFWRPLVAAGGSGSQSTTPLGANMAVTPPGFIFATGTNTTLVIAGNNGATIHYSVSYIKETA